MNNRGQTLLESLIVLIFVISGLFFILTRLLVYQKNLALDQLLQKTFFCLTEERYDCLTKLRLRTNEIGLNTLQINKHEQPDKKEIYYYGTDRFLFEYKKKVVFYPPQIS